MLSRRRLLSLSSLGLAALSLPTAAVSQGGARAARMLVGFPAGGSVDFVARALAGELQGVADTLVVENRGGAGGRIALEALKNAPPDGTVMLLTPGDQLSLFPHIYRSLPYNPGRDFAPVSTVCAVQFLISIGPMVPPDIVAFDAFVGWCRANPKRASYGTPGLGTRQHLLGETLAREAGVDLLHVPYSGAPQAMQDMLAGNIAANISVLSNALPHIQAGKLRALLTSGSSRSVALPDVPTAREAGQAALEAVEMFGLLVPRATPMAAVAALNAAVRRALASPMVADGLARLSFEATGSTPAEYAAIIGSETARWATIVRNVGFKPIE